MLSKPQPWILWRTLDLERKYSTFWVHSRASISLCKFTASHHEKVFDVFNNHRLRTKKFLPYQQRRGWTWKLIWVPCQRPKACAHTSGNSIFIYLSFCIYNMTSHEPWCLTTRVMFIVNLRCQTSVIQSASHLILKRQLTLCAHFNSSLSLISLSGSVE